MDWNIQSRARSCQECEKDFADREAVHTLLFSGPEAYERIDVCADCWRGQYADGANHRRGFISHWQTTHVIPAKTPEPIQRESAETLLRKLIELNDPAYTDACFVLAVMLERKRMLKTQARSRDEGRRIIHYEHTKSGDLFSVVDPVLQLDQLEAVQRQVSDLLEQGLPDAQQAAGPPGEDAQGATQAGPPVDQSANPDDTAEATTDTASTGVPAAAAGNPSERNDDTERVTPAAVPAPEPGQA